MSLRCLFALAAVTLTVVSCESTGRVDARYPTVTQMDSLDTQWGLPPRKSRGAPRRTYQYSAPPASATLQTPASNSQIQPPAREVINSAPPASLAPIPAELR